MVNKLNSFNIIFKMRNKGPRLNAVLISWGNDDSNNIQASSGLISHSMIMGDITGWQIKLNNDESNISIIDLKIKTVPAQSFIYCYRDKNIVYWIFDFGGDNNLMDQNSYFFRNKLEKFCNENEDIKNFYENDIKANPPEYFIIAVMNLNKIAQLEVIDVTNISWGSFYSLLTCIGDFAFFINKDFDPSNLTTRETNTTSYNLVSHGYRDNSIGRVIFSMFMPMKKNYWGNQTPMIFYFTKDLKGATILNIDKLLEVCVTNESARIDIVRQGIVKKSNWDSFKLTITGNIEGKAFYTWGAMISELDLSRLYYSGDNENNKLPSIVTVYSDEGYNSSSLKTGNIGPKTLILGNDCSHSTINVICTPMSYYGVANVNKIQHKVIGSGTNAPKINLYLSIDTDFYTGTSLSFDIYIKNILKWIFKDFHYDYCEELNLLLDDKWKTTEIIEYLEDYLDGSIDKFISDCFNFYTPVKNFNIKYIK